MRHDVIVPRDVPEQPWSNGAGSRRVLLHTSHWVVSLAEIREARTFSPFPGRDRFLIPLDGAELTRRIGAVEHRVNHDRPLRFRGEDEVISSPTDRCVRVLNVITTRDTATVGVTVRRGGSPAATPANATVLLDGWARVTRRLVPSGTVFLGGSTPVFSDDAVVADLHLRHHPTRANPHRHGRGVASAGGGLHHGLATMP